MGEIIAILLIVGIVGGAIYYIVRAKKKGVKCIGCPDRGTCERVGTCECKCHDINDD